ncbi:MAG: CHAP domain-containing protein [Candidatus Bruticola sp.]
MNALTNASSMSGMANMVGQDLKNSQLMYSGMANTDISATSVFGGGQGLMGVSQELIDTQMKSLEGAGDVGKTIAAGLNSIYSGGSFEDFLQATIGSMDINPTVDNEITQGATDMLAKYLKTYFPGMSDATIKAMCNSMVAQYGDVAQAMDLSSLASSVIGSSGLSASSLGESASSSSSVGNNGNYGANKGVSGLLSDASSMVGMTEQSNASSINAITKKSGINCQTTPWCAAWAMNMLKDHGVLDTSSCSNVNYCPTIVNWAKKEDIWAGRGSYTPQPGDAILFDWQGDGTSDHIGIVEKVANGKVYTIEGNSSDSVARRSYSLNSSKVMGYINCAAQK